MKKSTLFVVLALALGIVAPVQAITILSGPSFTKATLAPLAGTLQLTTDVPSRVSISVSNALETWQRDFFDYGTNHSVPLFGFKPARTNNITVTVWDRFRNASTATDPVVFITDPLPAYFPPYKVLVSKPEKMEPGYTLFRVVNNTVKVSYVTLVDNLGDVVWYSSNTQVPTTLDVRQLDNGDLFIPLSSSFKEVNLLGQTVQTWPVLNNLNVDSHEGVLTAHGTILYINDDTRVVTNFPTSSTNPNAPKQTTNVFFNRVIEMSATNSAVLHNWSLIDMLDPLRISYLTFTIRTSQGWDCEHANAVIEDPRDNSIIASMRHQNAVVKFSRATGQIKWILGPHENWGPSFQPYLLTPVGTPFAWHYGQHSPMLTPQGTLLLYDNGNFRASPFDTSVPDSANYSRAVEYQINEDTMEVSQVWEYGGNIPEQLYTDALGKVQWLPKTGNVLVNFGQIRYVNHARPSATSTNATMARIKEVTHDADPEAVFDLSFFDDGNTNSNYLGDWIYRSLRVPELYGHPALPVTDLNVTYASGLPHLQFSGDPVRTYVIEASSDLQNWTEIDTPEPGTGGTYDFEDVDLEQPSSRYYRVVTR